MYTVSMNLQQRYLCNHQTHISHRAPPRPAGCRVAVAVAGGSGRVRKEKKEEKR